MKRKRNIDGKYTQMHQIRMHCAYDFQMNHEAPGVGGYSDGGGDRDRRSSSGSG